MKNAILAVLTSIVRTVTPTIVGAVITWFTARGIQVDPDLEVALTLLIALAATGVYYTAVRLLETYVAPQFGWLLGVAKTPVAYTPESPAQTTPQAALAALSSELAKRG